jgi:hypothetical protein
MNFRPGDRVIIKSGPGAGLAGTVCARKPNDPAHPGEVRVQFDREPGIRYWAPVAGLDYEEIPKKAEAGERAQRKRKRPAA